jgi:signal transduction histidine kinase
MTKSYFKIKPAKWYFSFFIVLVLGFSTLLFFYNRNQAWNAFNFGISVLSDEMWEEVILFKNDFGFSGDTDIKWNEELHSIFHERVSQEFIDETIDSQLKAFGLLRIQSLLGDTILYESPEIKKDNFQFTDRFGKYWGYQPFQFVYKDLPCVGIGYGSTRINIHYFIGTVFENSSLEELKSNPDKYRRIAQTVFQSLSRNGLDLYVYDMDKLTSYLEKQAAWAYIYFIDSDSLLWASKEVEKKSLFRPEMFYEKSYYEDVKDAKGRSYRHHAELFDNNPNFAYRIDIAVPSSYVYRSIIFSGIFIWGGAIFIIIIAGIGGYLLRQKAMRPVNNVINIVNRLSSKSFDQRIPVEEVDEDIARLISTFNHLLDRLAEAFRQQKAFIADTSHELRTPLSILSFDIMEALKYVDSELVIAEHLKDANREIAHLARIVDDLQWLAKNDAGQLHVEKEHIRLDEILLDTLSRCQKFAAQKKVNLTIKKMDIVEIYGDEKLLIHSFSNLVNNAIKYSEEGGKVFLSVYQEDSKGILQVEDFGIGIPEEALDRIFERFYRVDTSRSRATGGSGLGLSIARQIAQLHSGKIEVKSVLGKGSRFSLQLSITNNRV